MWFTRFIVQKCINVSEIFNDCIFFKEYFVVGKNLKSYKKQIKFFNLVMMISTLQ